MNKEDIGKALQTLRSATKKRKFTQTVDIILNLQDLDFKKPEHQVDFFLNLPHSIGKKQTVCALIGPELEEEAKKHCDFVVKQSEFQDYQGNKAKLKKLAKTYDFFIGQATIMPKIAQIFGRFLGPRNKMPNPKAGAVVPPKANLKPLVDKLQSTLRVVARKDPILHLRVGSETMDDKELINNTFTLYDQVVHHLPREHHNIKTVFLKFTMSHPVKIYPELILTPPQQEEKKPKQKESAQSVPSKEAEVKKESKKEPKKESKKEPKKEVKKEAKKEKPVPEAASEQSES